MPWVLAQRDIWRPWNLTQSKLILRFCLLSKSPFNEILASDLTGRSRRDQLLLLPMIIGERLKIGCREGD